MRVQVRRGEGSGASRFLFALNEGRAEPNPIPSWLHQIHREANGTFNVFSRNSENMSVKYPDLMEQLPRVSRLPFTLFFDEQ